MARGKVKTTEEKITELEQELALLKAKKEVEQIKPEAEKLLKSCFDKKKVEQVIELLKK